MNFTLFFFSFTNDLVVCHWCTLKMALIVIPQLIKKIILNSIVSHTQKENQCVFQLNFY